MKKINDKINAATFTDIVKHNEDTVYERRLTREEYKRAVESTYQQICDLIERYNMSIENYNFACNTKTLKLGPCGRGNVTNKRMQ